MRILVEASFDEVCIAWLQHESVAHAAEYCNLTNNQWEAIHNPIADDPSQSIIRGEILFAPGRRDTMLRFIPKDAKWCKMEIDAGDYESLCLVRDPSWSEISQDSYCVSTASRMLLKYLRREWCPSTPDGKEKISAIIRYVIPRIQTGAIDKRLILLDEPSGARLVLEGNYRAIGICALEVLKREPPFIPHWVFVGRTPQPITG